MHVSRQKQWWVWCSYTFVSHVTRTEIKWNKNICGKTAAISVLNLTRSNIDVIKRATIVLFTTGLNAQLSDYIEKKYPALSVSVRFLGKRATEDDMMRFFC